MARAQTYNRRVAGGQSAPPAILTNFKIPMAAAGWAISLPCAARVRCPADMPHPLPIARLSIYTLAIPMRRKFEHAAAQRVCSEPIMVALELANGVVGYGETHPRVYVSGESHQDVLNSIRDIFVPRLLDLRPESFGEAIEAADALPFVRHDGASITAARAAVELAMLDAYSRAFDRSLESIAGYLDEPCLGPPGSRSTARYSVVLSGTEPKKALSTIRKARLGGIRHFKLKVGDANDDERLAAVVKRLRRGLERQRTTLVIDANGAWTVEQAATKLSSWQHLPITCVEQPLPKRADVEWGILAKRVNLPLMPDESLITLDDGRRFVEHGGAAWFNIRVSKNGGLIPAMRLAALARRHGLFYQLGCMVGETSLLSAAGRWFLQLTSGVRFAEGSFGPLLLKDDVVRKPLRFSLGGRWRAVTPPGLGVAVEPQRLQRLAVMPPIQIPF